MMARGSKARATGSARSLPRGPHLLSREQVAANQRMRIMKAMVDVVGERGYGATTVADLTGAAGVSRKAFYQHFTNKDECFLATYDAIVQDGFDRVASASRGPGKLRQQLGSGLDVLFELAIDHAPMQRLVLIEVAALGPAGIERRERLVGSYEALLRENLGVAPRPGPIRNPLLRAIVGGFLRLLYTHVQRRAQQRLPELIPDLVRWSFSYLPPPEAMNAIADPRPLRPRSDLVGGRAPGSLSPWSTSSRGRSGYRTPNVSRSFLVHSQRERVLDAIAQLSAEQGYGHIKVDDIVERAAVSLQAFYEHFADKEDAFLVAYEVGHGKSRAIVERAYDAAPDWPHGVAAGITALLEFLASEPAFAHMALLDALIATPRTAERSNRGVRDYVELLLTGFEQAPEAQRPPDLTIEAVAGGLFELCLTYALQHHVSELAELAPRAIYLALAPFIGTEKAWQVASEPSLE
jgi:AcrR family transcriptional regulator